MVDLAYTISVGLPYLVLLGQIWIIVTLIAIIIKKQLSIAHQYISKVRAHAATLALVVSSVCLLGSLFYSEIIGYIPCKLCWYQRILMYPQTVLLAGAVIREELTIRRELLALCALGLVVSGYHYGLQLFAMATPGFSDACTATGVSCATAEVFAFGYMTIPLMAFTGFAMIALLLVMGKTVAPQTAKIFKRLPSSKDP